MGKYVIYYSKCVVKYATGSEGLIFLFNNLCFVLVIPFVVTLIHRAHYMLCQAYPFGSHYHSINFAVVLWLDGNFHITILLSLFLLLRPSRVNVVIISRDNKQLVGGHVSCEAGHLINLIYKPYVIQTRIERCHLLFCIGLSHWH